MSYFLKKFVYLAGLGLSCSTQDPSLWCVAFLVVRRLNCFTACGVLVPRPGIKPVSPALQGGFLTPGPPGKSLEREFKITMIDILRDLLEK